MIHETLRSFGCDRKGNVAIILALSLVPAVFLIGMALDYSSAIQRRSQLNAAADAAALAAVTPSMMTQSDAAAQTAATNIFNAEASAMNGVSNTSPTVTITSSNGGLTRTALVSYSASSVNNFPGVLGQSKLDDFWILDRYSDCGAKHQFLSLARQFAVYGPSGHFGRNYGNDQCH